MSQNLYNLSPGSNYKFQYWFASEAESPNGNRNSCTYTSSIGDQVFDIYQLTQDFNTGIIRAYDYVPTVDNVVITFSVGYPDGAYGQLLLDIITLTTSIDCSSGS